MREAMAAMKILPMTAVAALLVLAACNSKPASPEVLDSNPDPMANTLTNAAPVELPPADGRRDGSGVPAGQPIAAVASRSAP